jgi:hypothetical protein
LRDIFMAEKLLFPIGRLLWGSLYEARTKDFDGNDLVIKTGLDAGKPTSNYQFGVAFKKSHPGEQWWETPWGQVIFKVGATDFPQQYQQNGFAWKVTDGDSTGFKKNGTKPINTLTGHAGHWVVSFKSNFPPKITTDNGSKQLVEVGAVKNGYFVQVYGSVAGNGNRNNPGVFVNHEVVNYAAWGEEIYTGVDPSAVGFGGALPPGASAIPPAGSFNPAVPAAPGMPAAPAPAMPTPAAAVPAMPIPAPVVAAPAPVAPAAPATGGVVMNPGSPYTYQQLIGANWTEDQIIAAGHATRAVAAPAMPANPGLPPAPAGVVPAPSFLTGQPGMPGLPQ